MENMTPQVERLWVYKSNAPPVAHLWFTTRLRHHETDSGKPLSGETVMAAKPFSTPMEEVPMEIDAVFGDIGKKGKHAKGKKGKKGKDKGKGKHRVNTRAVLSLRATVVTVESGETSRKTVDTRTLLPKWMRRSLSNLQTAVRAAARPESHLHLLVCLQLELRSPRRGRSPR